MDAPEPVPPPQAGDERHQAASFAHTLQLALGLRRVPALLEGWRGAWLVCTRRPIQVPPIT